MEAHQRLTYQCAGRGLVFCLIALSSTSCALRLLSDRSARTTSSRINNAIVVSFTSPAAESWVNNSSVSAVAVTGTCSEEGQDVILESSPAGVTATALCTNHLWSTILDLSPLGDGAVSLSATQVDQAGYVNPETILEIRKLVVTPTVSFTTPVPGGYANLATSASFTVSGTCSANGQNVVVGGAVSAIVPCTGGAWTTNLDLSGLADGPVSLTANITDVAGNTAAQASVAISKDVLPPGAFSISGATGVNDLVADGTLLDTSTVTANWALAAGASDYNVTIYQSNGTTVQCPTLNGAGPSITFTGCGLTFKQTYTIKVQARDVAGNTISASNDSFAFYVNRSPTAANDTIYVARNTNATLSVLANDTDPDTDALSIASIDPIGTVGGVTNNGGDITYNSGANFTGVDTLTYTVSDGHGGSSSATVTVKVMDPFTWTGALSSAWGTSGNWCGIVQAGACAGGPAPNNTQVAIFDGTCVGSSCNATVDVNPSVGGITMAAAYTGTITQSAGVAMSVGGSAWTMAGGTFLGSNASMTLTGSLALSGGTFTATSGTLTFRPAAQGGTVLSRTGGTFNHNNGTLLFDAAFPSFGQIAESINIPSGLTAYDVVYQASNSCGWGPTIVWTLGAGQTLTVQNSFTMTNPSYGGCGSGTVIANGGTIALQGNAVSTSGAAGGSTLLLLNGSATQTYNGSSGILPNVKVNKGTGSVVPAPGTTSVTMNSLDLTAGAFTAPTGNLTLYTTTANATVLSITGGTLNHNNGTLIFDGTANAFSAVTENIHIPNGLSAYNVNYQATNMCGWGPTIAWTLGAGQTLTVENTFSQYNPGYGGCGSASVAANGGTIVLSGNSFSAGGAAGGTTQLLFNSAGNQTYSSTGGLFPPVIINKPSGTVTPALGTTSWGAYSFDLIAGDFTAPSGNFLLYATIGGGTILNVTGGTFAHNNGTLVFDGTFSSFSSTAVNINIPSGLTAYNVSYQATNRCGWAPILAWTLGAGQTLAIQNGLTLDNAGYAGCGSAGVKADGGTLSVAGNVTFGAASLGGTSALTFTGAGNQTVSSSNTPLSGSVTVNKSGGALLLGSAMFWNAIGQSLTLTAGTIDMSGFYLGVTSLSLNGNTLTKSGGTLEVNGSVAGTGPLFGGTVDP